MADKDSLQERLEQLGSLSPDARARVELALKQSIESELAGSPVSSAPSFSRGIFFSRVAHMTASEDIILPAVRDMDEAKFEQFANRLARLRDIGRGGST